MIGPQLIPLLGYTPIVDPSAWLAPTAQVIGDVEIGANSSVWFNVTLRGDVGPIRIGQNTNIQDGSVIHGTFGKAFTTLKDNVTIGHGVILHGCTVEDFCLIGMGSLIMDNAVIGPRNIVGAGSLVTEGSQFLEEGWLILGRPAKAVRKLKPEELAFLPKSADNYLRYVEWYKNPNQFKARPTK